MTNGACECLTCTLTKDDLQRMVATARRDAVVEVAHELLAGAKSASWHQAGEAARAEVGRWLLARLGTPEADR